MVSVQAWTGREASALRAALRMSTRVFAEHLGVALRTVAKWESLGTETQPRPDSQAILDTALARADFAAQARFEALLFPERKSARPADFETWTEDIERAVVCISRQDFPFATTLMNRWLGRFDPHNLDDKGLYLYGRSLVLLGDLQRDQGAISARSPPGIPTPQLAACLPSWTSRAEWPRSIFTSLSSRKCRVCSTPPPASTNSLPGTSA